MSTLDSNGLSPAAAAVDRLKLEFQSLVSSIKQEAEDSKKRHVHLMRMMTAIKVREPQNSMNPPPGPPPTTSNYLCPSQTSNTLRSSDIDKDAEKGIKQTARWLLLGQHRIKEVPPIIPPLVRPPNTAKKKERPTRPPHA